MASSLPQSTLKPPSVTSSPASKNTVAKPRAPDSFVDRLASHPSPTRPSRPPMPSSSSSGGHCASQRGRAGNEKALAFPAAFSNSLAPVSEKSPAGSFGDHPPRAASRPIRGHSHSSSRRGQQYPPCPPAGQHTGSSLGCCSGLSPQVRLWISFAMWIATSLGFVLAVTFWKDEVFTGLDDLSHWLVEEDWEGYAWLFFLIFLTTIRTRATLLLLISLY